MGETGNTEKAQKKSFWKGLEAEYKKIIWPDKETLQKQTAAVVAGSCRFRSDYCGIRHGDCVPAALYHLITGDKVRLCQKRIGM